MPNKKYKNATNYRVNTVNILKSPDQDFKVNEDTLFVPESKVDPSGDYDRMMAKLRKDHPKFAPYLIGKYDRVRLDSMRNFDAVELLDNEQIPQTGTHSYTKEHKEKVRALLTSKPAYTEFLHNSLCLSLPQSLQQEFEDLIDTKDDEALDFLIDMGLAVKAFGIKYNNFEAFSPYEAKTDFAGRNTLVSKISKLCGVENVLPDVSTAVITNPQNEIVMKGETVKDTKGTRFLQGKWLDQIDPDRHDKNPDFVYPHDNPQCLKSIADLSVMYALMGKANYDFGDLAYHYDEKTGKITDFYLRSVNTTPGFALNDAEINIPMIDAKAAVAIMNLDPTEYRKTLEEAGISEKALSLAMKRLDILKEKLKNNEIEIVEDWSTKSLKEINKDYSEKVKLEQSRGFKESLTEEQAEEIKEKGKDKGLFSFLFYPKQTFQNFHKRVAHCEINLDTKMVLTEPGKDYVAPEDKVMTLSDAGYKKAPQEYQDNPIDAVLDQTDPMSLQDVVQYGMITTPKYKFTYGKDTLSDIFDTLVDGEPIYVYKPGQAYPLVVENVNKNLYMSEKPFVHPALKNTVAAYGSELRLAIAELYATHKKIQGNTSPEYKAVVTSLESLLLPLGDNGNMSLSKEMLDKSMPEILKACTAYEKHCDEDKKIFGTSKRETRLNVAKTLKIIASNYLEGKDSPRMDLENDLKERIINTLITVALLPGNNNQQLKDFAESLQEDKQLRDTMKEKLSDNPRFREIMQTKSASQLNKLLTSDTKSFLKEVVATVDGKKLMQTQSQKIASEKVNEKDAQKLGFKM